MSLRPATLRAPLAPRRCGTFPEKKNSLAATLVALSGLVTGCTEPVIPTSAQGTPVASVACLDNGNGFVNGELFGAVEMPLSWPNAGTECLGMARPGGGARIHFARKLPDADAKLTLIVGVEELTSTTSENGLGANVTLIDERDGAFYSNSGVPNCWVDIFRQTELPAGDATQVDGILYCSGALAQRQGKGAVTPREIRFSGRIEWPAVSEDNPKGDGT